MEVMIFICLMICIGLRLIVKKDKNELVKNDDLESKSKSKSKKFVFGVLAFFPLFIMFYFIVAIIGLIITWIFVGPLDGSWGYSILLGMAFSPILAILVILKILNKNEDK